MPINVNKYIYQFGHTKLGNIIFVTLLETIITPKQIAETIIVWPFKNFDKSTPRL